jgi:hypothetical protein
LRTSINGQRNAQSHAISVAQLLKADCAALQSAQFSLRTDRELGAQQLD